MFCVHSRYFTCFCFADLYKMVCNENDTSLNVTIPVVMIPKSAGENLRKSLANGERGELSFLYLVNFRWTLWQSLLPSFSLF